MRFASKLHKGVEKGIGVIMRAEVALGRVGLWFLVLVISIVLAATARDTGFAAHAIIIAIVSFVLMWMSAARFDPMGKARGFFRMPQGASL